jgi:hypothetical protein
MPTVANGRNGRKPSSRSTVHISIPVAVLDVARRQAKAARRTLHAHLSYLIELKVEETEKEYGRQSAVR